MPKKIGNGYIYLIRDSRTGLTKIGFSKDPNRRIRDLMHESTLLPEPLSFEIVDAFSGTLQEEQRLHKVFAARRVRGEWFDLCFFSYFEICDNFDERVRMPGKEWFHQEDEDRDWKPFDGFQFANPKDCPCDECKPMRYKPIAYANVRYF